MHNYILVWMPGERQVDCYGIWGRGLAQGFFLVKSIVILGSSNGLKGDCRFVAYFSIYLIVEFT